MANRIVVGASEIKLHRDGFICVDGVKIGRLVNGCLQVYDKDRQRSAVRGSQFIYIPLSDLTNRLRTLQETQID